MKILASDYDGTLCIDEVFREQTLAAIHRWKAAGNQFGIVTGRDIRMARDVIEEHSIPIDFLICNNGCVLYDKDYREIQSSYLPIEQVHALINSPVAGQSSYIVLADKAGRYVYDDDYAEEKYTEVYYTEVLNSENIKEHTRFYQMDTRYADAKEMHQVKEELEEEFGRYVNINPNVTTIDITPKDVTKLTGLRRYFHLQGLKDAEVITAGDGFNDLPMMEAFRGYTVENAVGEIKDRVGRVVRYVEEIIEQEL